MKDCPKTVGFNLINSCNLRCAWCFERPPALYQLSLDSLKKMKWLKSVKNVMLWGGYGDSLMHPDFLEIFSWMRTEFPRVNLDLSTNGLLLTEEINRELVGKLDHLNCSLDCASEETFIKLKGRKGFTTVVGNLKDLSERRRHSGQPRPRLSLSFVVVKENIGEFPTFMELSNRLGFDEVNVTDYIPQAQEEVTRCLSASSSLHNDPHAVEITRGAGRYSPPWDAKGLCPAPHETMLIIPDRAGQARSFACCNQIIHFTTTGEICDMSDLMKAWKGKIFKALRKDPANPMCADCKKSDPFDPEKDYEPVRIEMERYLALHSGGM